MDCKECPQIDKIKDKVEENTKKIDKMDDKFQESIYKNIKDRTNLNNLFETLRRIEEDLKKSISNQHTIISKQDERIEQIETKVNKMETNLAVNDERTNKTTEFIDSVTMKFVVGIIGLVTSISYFVAKIVVESLV